MGQHKLRGKDLKKLGCPEKQVSLLLQTLQTHHKRMSKDEQLELASKLLADPTHYQDDAVFGKLAKDLVQQSSAITLVNHVQLRKKVLPYQMYDAAGIEPGAKHQMNVAMKLPVTVAGALMADAHQGYGLPIGGVLATDQAVIPYGVGVDIGCRMSLSIYGLTPKYLQGRDEQLRKMLLSHTKFGLEAHDKPMDDPILEHRAFQEIAVVRSLKDKAWRQIGSSGGGNHFVEFGIVTVSEADAAWDLPPGEYVAVLSHSGSRALGASIAGHYTKLAMAQCRLPKEAKHLSWLDLNTEAGQEYWQAMNLAGEYASACHRHIHHRLSKALGERPLITVENHHNFAWKEEFEGRTVIVHRKGATPAGKGVLGVIPGSMTAPGFIVRGKGDTSALNSASHGAGRVLSRSKAKASFTRSSVIKELKHHGVQVIGSGLDEAPGAYKDIFAVMAAQESLVETLGRFTPKVVRMAGDKKSALGDEDD